MSSNTNSIANRIRTGTLCQHCHESHDDDTPCSHPPALSLTTQRAINPHEVPGLTRIRAVSASPPEDQPLQVLPRGDAVSALDLVPPTRNVN
jgi:hypothetical protein